MNIIYEKIHKYSILIVKDSILQDVRIILPFAFFFNLHVIKFDKCILKVTFFFM